MVKHKTRCLLQRILKNRFRWQIITVSPSDAYCPLCVIRCCSPQYPFILLQSLTLHGLLRGFMLPHRTVGKNATASCKKIHSAFKSKLFLLSFIRSPRSDERVTGNVENNNSNNNTLLINNRQKSRQTIILKVL